MTELQKGTVCENRLDNYILIAENPIYESSRRTVI